jgi:hypothetical protein
MPWRFLLKPRLNLSTTLPSSMANRSDFFSRFVNWLSASGRDGASINRQGGSSDPFSRLMNHISG